MATAKKLTAAVIDRLAVQIASDAPFAREGCFIETWQYTQVLSLARISFSSPSGMLYVLDIWLSCDSDLASRSN